jgi:20S proteasome subunit alpha 7
VVCKDGIILGTEKIVVNKMMLSGTDKRSYSIAPHVGCVVNGIVPDGRALMNKGREEAAQYKQMFGVNIPGQAIADRLALKAQMNTVYAQYRPFGSSMMLCCHDNMLGPSLWMIEPSGTCYQYYGCSSGRGRQMCRNEIEKTNFRELTVQQALPKVAKVLLKAQEEMKDKKQELELSVLCADTKWTHKILDRHTVDQLTAHALTEIEAEEDDQ